MPSLLPPPRGLPTELHKVLRTAVRGGHLCQLVYRTPGTSAEFSVRGILLDVLRREQVDYLQLAGGCELRLDWLVAIDGHRLAA